MSAPRSVVFPEPVPPETRMFRRERSALRAALYTASGSDPMPTRSLAVNARAPKRRTVIATSGLAGGAEIATLEPSASLASRIGLEAGSSPSGRAIWIAAR